MSESTVPVFISWSGEPSRVVAQALATFINDCIQAAVPWTSDDISKGAAWPDAIQSRLQSSVVGIVCVTKANQAAPWLLFEGGALAKHKTLNVFLIDAKPTDIKPPLGLYQHTAAEKGEVLKLLLTIDAKVPEAHRRGMERLRKDCDRSWSELEAAISRARAHTEDQGPVRSERELLEELLTTVRGLADTNVERLLDKWPRERIIGSLALRNPKVVELRRELEEQVRERALGEEEMETLEQLLNAVAHAPTLDARDAARRAFRDFTDQVDAREDRS